MSNTYTPRFTKLDWQIIRYVAENPGCTKRSAGTAGDRLTRRGEEYRRERVDILIHRGLIRDEGRSNRASLHLTDAGKAIISEGA